MRSVVSSVISLSRGVPVRVVVVPPLVRRGLGVALRRVLPLLLAAERRYVEVGPGGSHGLVAAGVDEVGAEDAVAFADERVGAVPLADAEVLVEVVRDRVPGDQRPGHPRLPVLDVLLRRAGDERERGVAGVQMGEVGDLVGEEGAAAATALGIGLHTGVVEKAVD